jgi:uncharacterized membrane protein
MTEFLLLWFVGFPRELAVTLLAMLPVAELRVSIPVATTVLDLPLVSALFFSYLGNAMPLLLLWLLPPLREVGERRCPAWSRVLDRYVHRKQERFRESYERYGALALFFFVAIPLPLTGVWSGVLLAVLFHIQPRRSVPAILGGMLVAGAIVTLVVQGTLGFLSWLV